MSIWRKAVIVPALLSLIVGLSGMSEAWAAGSSSKAKSQQSQINSQMSQLKNQLNEVSGDESDLLGKLDDANNRKSAIDAQLGDLQAKMNDVQTQLNASTAHLQQVQAQVDKAQADWNAAEAGLAATTNQIREQAVNAYMGGQTDQDLANFVLHANDMREVSAASEYLHQVVEDRRAVVEQHRELEGRARDAKSLMDKSKEQAEADRQAIAQHQQQLQTQQNQLSALQGQAKADADQQAQLLQQVQEKRSNIEQQMNDLQAESDSIAAMLRNADQTSGGGGGGGGGGGNGGPPPPAGHGVFTNPAPGAPMTSPFGMRLDPVLNRYQLHAGQDFGVPVGTQVHAAGDGTVVSAGWVTGYGNYTCINHGGGLATCYAHQSSILVSVGQHVSRNQVIGLSGNTGYSTGPHLHFEVRVNGNPVNPLGYL